MSIIVNGVTIPNNGDYIKVGSTLVDKVDVVKNNVRITVWEKIKEIYIWKDGSIQSGYGVSLWGDIDSSKCTWNRDNNHGFNPNGFYGLTVNVHYIQNGGYRITGNVPTNGAKYVEYNVIGDVSDWGKGERTWSMNMSGLTVGNGNMIGAVQLWETSQEQNPWPYGSLCTHQKYDISPYTHLEIKIRLKTGSESTGTVSHWIEYIRLSND